MKKSICSVRYSTLLRMSDSKRICAGMDDLPLRGCLLETEENETRPLM